MARAVQRQVQRAFPASGNPDGLVDEPTEMRLGEVGPRLPAVQPIVADQAVDARARPPLQEAVCQRLHVRAPDLGPDFRRGHVIASR